jgi:carnitine O-acetyltransferase
MAIQLAWFRQVGTVVSTYETGLTRLFKHGRTETIRTLSSESYAWVKAMDSEEDVGFFHTKRSGLRVSI